MRRLFVILILVIPVFAISSHTASAATQPAVPAMVQRLLDGTAPPPVLAASSGHPDYYFAAAGVTCESGGSSCIAGTSISSPLDMAHIWVIRNSAGTVGRPDFVWAICTRYLPDGRGGVYGVSGGGIAGGPFGGSISGNALVLGSSAGGVGRFLSLGISSHWQNGGRDFPVRISGGMVVDNTTGTVRQSNLSFTVNGGSASGGHPVPPTVTCRISSTADSDDGQSSTGRAWSDPTG